MGTELISGVYFRAIEPIRTTGGSVLRTIKGLDVNLPEFAECYFSTAEFQKPKAWKKHSKMICNIFIPHGKVRFVFYDDRAESEDFGKIVEFEISPANYGRLIIKPGIWFGFAGTAAGESIIMNLSNIPHDPAESIRLEPGAAEIPFTWQFQQRS